MTSAKAPFETSTALVLSRLRDFFAHRTPWHRRLWSIGTQLALVEVVEYADACLSGAVGNTEGLRYVIATARREASRDPGTAPIASELVSCLDRLDSKSRTSIPVDAKDELEQLSRRLEVEYVDNWCNAATDQPVEFTARAFASHLLDLGYSPDHLYRWITAVGPDLTMIEDLARSTLEMLHGMPVRPYDIFVPCAAPFQKPQSTTGSVRWLDGKTAAAWLSDASPSDGGRRQSGGFLLRIECRDPWSAVDAARSTIARADARAKVSRPSSDRIRLDGWARIANDDRDYEIQQAPRRVEIGSLYRQNAVYLFDGGLPSETDDALELASYMKSSSDGTAVTGGWAAVEALLIRPGEGNHHTAADRLASLIACSVPRAELTPLAFQHMDNADDALALSLHSSTTNYEKVRHVEDYLRSGKRLCLASPSDIAAQNRIVAILEDPHSELQRIRTYVTESLRRLYNQRNHIAHSGSFRSAALAATTRTALTLVGAGLDRIVHAQLETRGGLQPLSLVARADTELRLVGSPGGRQLSSLLE